MTVLSESGEWVVDEAKAAREDLEAGEEAEIDSSDQEEAMWKGKKGKKGKAVVEDSSCSDEGEPSLRGSTASRATERKRRRTARS
eukprot:5844703-Pleurochrysis_carterae.AAC.1